MTGSEVQRRLTKGREIMRQFACDFDLEDATSVECSLWDASEAATGGDESGSSVGEALKCLGEAVNAIRRCDGSTAEFEVALMAPEIETALMIPEIHAAIGAMMSRLDQTRCDELSLTAEVGSRIAEELRIQACKPVGVERAAWVSCECCCGGGYIPRTDEDGRVAELESCKPCCGHGRVHHPDIAEFAASDEARSVRGEFASLEETCQAVCQVASLYAGDGDDGPANADREIQKRIQRITDFVVCHAFSRKLGDTFSRLRELRIRDFLKVDEIKAVAFELNKRYRDPERFTATCGRILGEVQRAAGRLDAAMAAINSAAEPAAGQAADQVDAAVDAIGELIADDGDGPAANLLVRVGATASLWITNRSAQSRADSLDAIARLVRHGMQPR